MQREPQMPCTVDDQRGRYHQLVLTDSGKGWPVAVQSIRTTRAWLFQDVANYDLPTKSNLSPTLIPILVDRGVPEQALHELFQASLAHEKKSLMDAVQSRQSAALEAEGGSLFT